MLATTLSVDGLGRIDQGSLVMLVAIGGGLFMIIVAIIFDSWRKVSQTRAKEESRREIAAYVAEGSISADDAAKLLGTSGKGCLKDAVKDKIREAVERM